MIPKAAVDFIKNKKLKTGFSCKDVRHEEHAAAFTAAKAIQPDALSGHAQGRHRRCGEGQSFKSSRKNIKPLLQEKGWRGKKEMADPVTGQTVNVQPGRGRRLKTIRRVNMRSAFQRGQWEKTQASALHPYLNAPLHPFPPSPCPGNLLFLALCGIFRAR